jgi:hypothetical protein
MTDRIIQFDESPEYHEEMNYLLGIIMDVLHHYLHDDSRSDYLTREGAIPPVLSGALYQHLYHTNAPKEALEQYLLKPYQDLYIELKNKNE